MRVRQAPEAGAAVQETPPAKRHDRGAGTAATLTFQMAVRSLLLDSRVKRPPQFAALAVCGTLPHRLSKQQRQYWGLPSKGPSTRPEPAAAIQARLDDTELRAGGLLVARAPASQDAQHPENHCEAMLLRRLAAEPAHKLRALSPIVLFSFLCPCEHCAQAICGFALSRPNVLLHVVYERRYSPDSRTAGDRSNVNLLKQAGVLVTHTQDLPLETQMPLVAHRELSQVVRVSLVKGRAALFVQRGPPVPLSEVPVSEDTGTLKHARSVWAADDEEGGLVSVLPGTKLAPIQEG